LLEGGPDDVIALQGEFAARPGSIVTIQSAQTSDCDAGLAYRADWLCNEVSTSINTTAAGGNASLMAMST
jgi:RHH-type proline utilization regulon transcriptional repressor/proline dehydrogenase/delta 1-pyrroline-5-carboxylate dehydrogenase